MPLHLESQRMLSFQGCYLLKFKVKRYNLFYLSTKVIHSRQLAKCYSLFNLIFTCGRASSASLGQFFVPRKHRPCSSKNISNSVFLRLRKKGRLMRMPMTCVDEPAIGCLPFQRFSVSMKFLPFTFYVKICKRNTYIYNINIKVFLSIGSGRIFVETLKR